MANNSFSNYNNPYGMYDIYPNRYNLTSQNNNQYQGFNRPQQLLQYTFVNGIEGAKSYPLVPNQTMLLMDADHSIAYRKASDSEGRCSINYYQLTEIDEATARKITQPVEVQPQNNYASKEDIENLNKKLDELLKTLPRNNTKKEMKENNNA